MQSGRRWGKKLSYRRDSARQQSLRRSRLLKVTDFDTNWKPLCHFILVNTNLYPISHRFPDSLLQIIGQIFAVDRGIHICSGEPLNLGLQNVTSKN